MASKPQASHLKATVPSDGTTDYQPLRSGAYDMKKPHITELPMTWRNWYQHLDWLSIYFIIVVPISGLIAATQVPLQLYTGLFAVVYYVICGSGITAGMSNVTEQRNLCDILTPNRIPSPLGSLMLQGNPSAQDILGSCRSRCCSRKYQMVVERSSSPSSIHRYIKGPILCEQRVLV
jgi:hypothetical protein